ncbi:N-6 DNA methylase [Bradyrhizobium sp. 149]|uniref:type ISP restriction/modification enzyme n=1 Tax=Bradyrhizobium sp. 149 TaxID=2782624 RepID=UPI001FFA062A|nr:type ISP restriction/modification enzyme [Bradyrhizobium sp. 149]MCK1653062.1 N-6 DNA methylase [Bradyrhizobium sp. 149]
MVEQHIRRYLNELSDLRRVSGEARESIVSEAFKTLLKEIGKTKELVFIPQYRLADTTDRRYVDGALLFELRVPFGYWEAKDEEDDLDEEIAKKFRRGYPQDNIIFEDTREAVLIQNRKRVSRCRIDDPAELAKLLEAFFAYERAEIADFRRAVEQFKVDLPAVLNELRRMIETSEQANPQFKRASEKFLRHAQDTINPKVSPADVREMLIQHILTEEIFSQVFDNSDFHRQNNVARELYDLENTFFKGKVKYDTMSSLKSYYAAIKSAAALVANHVEKQTFLKTIYENFYKVYNKKAADRLGVVYTPNEIVKFMIASTDWLCHKHFGKSLIEKNVEILDPAAGTGTFITELIEHFRGQPNKLRYKYLEELHANEVAILPYYVANLNIEASYAAIAGAYEEFPNLCFVDTLDNTTALRAQRGQQIDLFGGVSEENVERIKSQNKKKISVVIGNPPYNANQLNENDNNKNREYPIIDDRIRATYINQSNAQKTKLYDMYARFFRWASDRIDDNGIIAFISNRGFLDKRTYDGFRKTVLSEFNDIYVLDLGGDVRDDPSLSGTTHNVFGIQTGVAISFLIKRSKTKDRQISYARLPQKATAEEKLSYLESTKFETIEFDRVKPTPVGDWINLANTDFGELLPFISHETKYASNRSQERALFKLYTLGISTNRDDWVTDFSKDLLQEKMAYFIKVYKSYLSNGFPEEPSIKLSRNLKRRGESQRKEAFSAARIAPYSYRPFVQKYFYNSELFVDERGSTDELTARKDNVFLCFIGDATEKPFSVLASNGLIDLNFLSAAAAGTKIVPLYRGDEVNLTDWGKAEFVKHYANENGHPKIDKEAIFHYVYAVLHDPIYREKYALNLKREFPRIPLYSGFREWAEWGEKLMKLHIGYRDVKPFALRAAAHTNSKTAILRTDKDAGIIYLDGKTALTGVPDAAWSYRIGNRCAIDWVLDQYKEKSETDETIRERFDRYQFSTYKVEVIDLLKKVTSVSVETMKIAEEMKRAKR